MRYFTHFSLLYKNRNYGLLYLGQLATFLGSMITKPALPYLVYQQTHSVVMVGLLSLIQILPLFFSALFGGVLADRYPRRTILIVTETALAVCCLIMAWNVALSLPQLWLLYVVIVFMAGLMGLHRPALDSIFQQIVNKTDYATVAAQITLKINACMIIGPILGGMLIATYGVKATFLVDFVGLLISISTLLALSAIPPLNLSQFAQSNWAAFKNGLHYAVSRQELLGSYLIDFVALVCAMPYALFPAIAHSLGSAKTLGLLYAAPAAGGLVVIFISGWVSKITYHGRALALTSGLWGGAIIGFGLATNVYFVLAFLALSGAFDALGNIFRNILWNETIPIELRGRQASIIMIAYLSGMRLGDARAGCIATFIGVTGSIVSGGLLCMVGVGICCYCLPKFWNYKSR